MTIIKIILVLLFLPLALFALFAALVIFGVILFCCAIYGSIVGAVKGFISYFAALHDELGGSI